MEEKHGKRKRKQEKDTNVLLIRQEQSCTSRTLQVHSGRSLIDPSLQDNVNYSEQFLPLQLITSDVKTMYHRGEKKAELKLIQKNK